MKKSLIPACALLLMVVSAMAGDAKPASVESAVERAATGFVSLLIRGDFQKATAQFDETMLGALPPAKLEDVWKSELETWGDYQKIEATRMLPYQGYRIVFVTCLFKNQSVDVKVVYDQKDRIAGLFFVPPQSGEPRTPVYAKENLFHDREVTFGVEGWILPGTLSMPVGKGPFPVLILVHGSGPNDQDESIGPNKPFRDLAWGLASQGIAVLRYEKRTHKYAARIMEIKDLTVKEETITDALEAVSFMRKTEGVDAGRVFVLGHSLGGMLAPRIAAGNTAIAGLVILAGPARPLEDLILEQTLYQASLSGELSPEDQKKVEDIKRTVAAVKKLSKESPAAGLLLGAPASYWLDLRDYKPVLAAKTLKQPMLILQGEKDCQVRMDDFTQWRNALSSRTDVLMKSYPALNHLFMEVPGRSTGAEYQQPDNVAVAVVNDIADWIRKH